MKKAPETTSIWTSHYLPKFLPGQQVYWKGYLAEVLVPVGKTLFRKEQKYLIDSYVDQIGRRTVRESSLHSTRNLKDNRS